MANDPSNHCGDCSLASVVAFALASPRPNPYRTSLSLCHAAALLTFAASTATGDLSQVDRLWSILPAAYAWIAPVVDARTALMACLATAWSARLTYNFRRRGGYGAWPTVWRGEEDYRWGALRSGAPGGRWLAPLADARVMAAFNAVFISLFQNYLLLYIASPSLFVWSMATGAACCHGDGGGGGGEEISPRLGMGRAVPPMSTTLNVVDCIATVLFVVSLVGETVADNQQWAFQNGKRAWRLANSKGTSAGLSDAGGGLIPGSSPRPPSSIERQYDDGFCQSGLFAIVRKPAYAFEQLVWISYHLISVAAVAGRESNRDDGHRRYSYWNWSAGGCILLCLLFQASGWLTEEISISKYPAYREYRERVPLYVPRISSLPGLFAWIAGKDRKKGK